MTKEKKPSKLRKKINEVCEENELLSIQQNRNRARSITVGTAFGGITEINVRSDSGSLYAQMQPTEVIELIEQLSAGIGVEIAMRPKQNFASWRGWEEVIQQRIGFDKIAWKGAALWQLNGDLLEENHQKKLELSKTEQIFVKQLESEESKTPTKTIRKRKIKEETNE
jgi:regulator of replication initiation timing